MMVKTDLARLATTADPRLDFSALVALVFVLWYAAAGYVWIRFRRDGESRAAFLLGGRVLLDRRRFRPDGHAWLMGIRIAFVALVVPLLFLLFRRGGS